MQSKGVFFPNLSWITFICIWRTEESGKRHKRLRGVISFIHTSAYVWKYVYILPYAWKPSFHTRVIFCKDSKEKRFFSANLTFDSRHIIKLFRYLLWLSIKGCGRQQVPHFNARSRRQSYLNKTARKAKAFKTTILNFLFNKTLEHHYQSRRIISDSNIKNGTSRRSWLSRDWVHNSGSRPQIVIAYSKRSCIWICRFGGHE